MKNCAQSQQSAYLTPGKALGDLSPNASYEAAKKKELGVNTFRIGGKIRVPSIEVLRKLGLAEQPSPTAEAATSARATPAPSKFKRDETTAA